MKGKSVNFHDLLLYFFIGILFLSWEGLASETDKSAQEKEEEKIQFLLNEVKNSGLTFVRNGDEHPAQKASEHLEYKMNTARKMFWFFGPSKKISAVEFIEKIASKSSTTGEIYQIKLKDGTLVPTEKWLKEKLKLFPQKSESP